MQSGTERERDGSLDLGFNTAQANTDTTGVLLAFATERSKAPTRLTLGAGYRYGYSNYHSANLVKIKPVLDDEFPVVGYTQGTRGKDVGAVIWECEVPNPVDPRDRRFTVVPKDMTYEERYAVYKCLGALDDGPDGARITRFERDIKGLPVTVEYRERLSAAGRIPGSFQRREGRITDAEVLTSRLADRSIRPQFPDGFLNEVQVLLTVLSADPEVDPEALSILGAAAALHLSPSFRHTRCTLTPLIAPSCSTAPCPAAHRLFF